MRELKQNLDHQLWKLLKLHGLQEKRILVALSGGPDSVALLVSLSKTHDLSKLAASYFHHGDNSNQSHRQQALQFCKDLCESRGVPFFPLKTEKTAHSEMEYRELRYEVLRRLKKEQNYDILATGHHADDLLETRMLRLIRGTGLQGLQAMQEFDGELLRPWLSHSKKELLEYLVENKISSLEDPTNKSLDPLRNWLRQEWLASLEVRTPGAKMVLARSLETILNEVRDFEEKDILREALKEGALQRSFYLTLGPSEQKRLLAKYLYSLGKRDFSQAHIEEIQKRLDKSQKVITFQVGGCHWQINAEQIRVQS